MVPPGVVVEESVVVPVPAAAATAAAPPGVWHTPAAPPGPPRVTRRVPRYPWCDTEDSEEVVRKKRTCG